MAEQNTMVLGAVRYFKTEALKQAHLAEIGDYDLVLTGETVSIGTGSSGGSSGGTSGGGGITTETDPIFSASVAATITQAMINAWNNKGTSNLTLGTTATTAAAGNHNHDGVYLKTYTEQFQGTVKSVNSTTPDANGNVSLTIPSAVTDSTVSGWGYLKPVTLASNANLDTITDSGFYIAPQSHTITSPGTAGTCFGMIVIRRHPTSANYVTQIVFYGGTDTIIQYERSRSGTTWGTWYNISLNNYYTKTEVDSLVGDVETLINAL